MTFEKFHNRVVIEATLVAATPIFIGARGDSFKPGEVNGACVKDAYDRPYIPGSSLKGVLRAFLSSVPLEQSSDSEDKIDDDGKKVIRKNTSDFLSKDKRDEEVRIAKKNDKEKYQGKKDDEILAELILEASSLVERLFGSPIMAGKVKIADALPIEDHVAKEVRNGVAIDRDTRTAQGGMLFDTEVVPAGTAFSFNASAENLQPAEADLFSKLIEYFADGNITVGGRSRAGLGKVKLNNIAVTIHRAALGSFPLSEEIVCDKSGISIREAICKCSQN